MGETINQYFWKIVTLWLLNVNSLRYSLMQQYESF